MVKSGGDLERDGLRKARTGDHRLWEESLRQRKAVLRDSESDRSGNRRGEVPRREASDGSTANDLMPVTRISYNLSPFRCSKIKVMIDHYLEILPGFPKKFLLKARSSFYNDLAFRSSHEFFHRQSPPSCHAFSAATAEGCAGRRT